jgi:hypothetical protein
MIAEAKAMALSPDIEEVNDKNKSSVGGQGP